MFEFFFAAAAAAAVVSCNLKNITTNCQNALTFTNYFAGSSHGVPVIWWCSQMPHLPHRLTAASNPLAAVGAA